MKGTGAAVSFDLVFYKKYSCIATSLPLVTKYTYESAQSVTQKKNILIIVNSVWNQISNVFCVDPQLFLRRPLAPDGELFIYTSLRKNC